MSPPVVATQEIASRSQLGGCPSPFWTRVAMPEIRRKPKINQVSVRIRRCLAG
jgi:hypothetical protein